MSQELKPTLKEMLGGKHLTQAAAKIMNRIFISEEHRAWIERFAKENGESESSARKDACVKHLQAAYHCALSQDLVAHYGKGFLFNTGLLDKDTKDEIIMFAKRATLKWVITN